MMTVALLCTPAFPAVRVLMKEPKTTSHKTTQELTAAFFGDMSPIKTDRSHGIFPHDSSFPEEEPLGSWGSCS